MAVTSEEEKNANLMKMKIFHSLFLLILSGATASRRLALFLMSGGGIGDCPHSVSHGKPGKNHRLPIHKPGPEAYHLQAQGGVCAEGD
jgi:hypothetical protein